MAMSNKGVFSILVDAFKGQVEAFDKIYNIAYQKNLFSQCEYPLRAVFKALRSSYYTLVTYTRDMLAGDDSSAAMNKIKIVDNLHKHLVISRSRFEQFSRMCNDNAFTDDLPF